MALDGLPNRLKTAIRHADLSQADAQEQLERKGVRGASQGNFYKILGGQSTPSAEFIAEVSSVTGVSADWLLTGTGEMRRKEPISREVVEEYGLEDLPEAVQHDVVGIAQRFLVETDRTGLNLDDTFERIGALSRGIAAWLRLPLRSDKVRDLKSDLERTTYCDAALRALQMLIPDEEEEPKPPGEDAVLTELAELEARLTDGPSESREKANGENSSEARDRAATGSS